MATSNYKRIQEIKSHLECIEANRYYHRDKYMYDSIADNAWEVFVDIQKVAEASTNDFIKAVCQSVEKWERISEKQAFVIARFAAENEMTFWFDEIKAEC